LEFRRFSGNNAGRIFDIDPGESLNVAGLTLTAGIADGVNGADFMGGGGGAILNQGGNLTLANDMFTSNQAFPHGGAIANYPSSTFSVTDSTFIGNRTVGHPGSDWVEGGAIWDSGPNDPNLAVTGTVIGCTFIGNQAIGGNGGTCDNDHNLIGSALGGAITNDEGRLMVVSGCTFAYNQAIGGNNAQSSDSTFGYIGAGRGGALTSGAVANVTDSTFIGNEALGGNGNSGGSGALLVGVGDGGAIVGETLFGPVQLNVTNCTFHNNQAIDGVDNVGNTTGVFVGNGMGGVLENFGGLATFSNCTFDHNQASGGQRSSGGNGGDGLGGVIANQLGSTATLTNCTLDHNMAVGGDGEDGGNGGNGLGGGIYNDGSTPSGVSSLTIAGSTITHNEAKGGKGDGGGTNGQGIGGGLYLAAGGSVCLDAFT
jgi:hypothetical protein